MLLNPDAKEETIDIIIQPIIRDFNKLCKKIFNQYRRFRQYDANGHIGKSGTINSGKSTTCLLHLLTDGANEVKINHGKTLRRFPLKNCNNQEIKDE